MGDTANRYNMDPHPNVYWLPNASASITIQGLGTYAFLTPTTVFNNRSYGSVGFNKYGAGWTGWDLFYIPGAGSSGWDMLTSFGPVTTVTGTLLQWSLGSISTSGGVLVFSDSYNIHSTFTAQVVPEPSSPVALAGGLIPLIAMIRRRRA